MEPLVPRLCDVEECSRAHEAKGFCRMHYQRFLKYGDPLQAQFEKGATIEESFRLHTIAAPEGECILWTGSRNGAKKYGMVWYQGRMQQAHRVSWELSNGPIPEGLLIDHMCHTTLCVNANHLRTATYTQNNENVQGPRSTNKTGVLGVSWHKASQKYIAQVSRNGKSIYLGGYDSIEEAGQVAKAKRLELFTHNDLDRKAA